MTAQRWMKLWERTVTLGLQACQGVPTIVYSHHELLDDIPKATQQLLSMLTQAGEPPTPSAALHTTDDLRLQL